MKVSIVTPTFNRADFLPRLHRLFAAQTHADLELVILDDSPQPTDFFARLADDRVRYVHRPERLPLGVKRNMLAELASGEVLMHFDDDNYYAPTYVATMLASLGEADFVKLSGWYLYSMTHRLFAYWDLATVAPYHYRLDSGQPIALVDNSKRPAAEARDWGLKNMLGWGSTFTYRRAAWQRHPFAEVHHGEDAQFVRTLLAGGCDVRQSPDRAGLILVMRDERDMSVVFPQYALPPHLLRQVFPGAVGVFVDEPEAAIAWGGEAAGRTAS